MRNWSKQFFSKQNLVLTEFLSNLTDLKSDKYQNVVVRIKERKLEETKNMLMIEDEKLDTILEVNKNQNGNNFEYFKEGDICIIRSIKKRYYIYNFKLLK